MAKKTEGKKTWTRSDLERIRSIAEDLYINKGYSLEQIIKDWDVSAVTLSKWKKGRPTEKTWDERKVFNELTPSRLKEVLLEEALSIAQGNPSKFKADALSKIMSAVDRIDKRINTRIVISVFKDFDNWMVDQDPKQAVEFTKWHKLFILDFMMHETSQNG